jgi:hypothetical protein
MIMTPAAALPLYVYPFTPSCTKDAWWAFHAQIITLTQHNLPQRTSSAAHPAVHDMTRPADHHSTSPATLNFAINSLCCALHSAVRHVYYPALRFGLSRWPAMILVFFVSAVFHELVLGVPLHMVRLWAFTGIMLQVGSRKLMGMGWVCVYCVQPGPSLAS